MQKHIQDSGFSPPAERGLGNERRTAVFAELIATAALAGSTIVAATAVSIGIARASVADGVVDNQGSLFVIAMLLGLIFIGIGGAGMLPTGDKRRR